MPHPTFADARELVSWRPQHGVISVYLNFDPADRAGAWRTELRNSLAHLLEAPTNGDHGARTALRATVARLQERFANHERGLPRGEAGFVEVSDDGGAERWWSPHVPPQATVCACLAERPVIAPLLYLAEHGCARGAALLSADRVRLFEWAPGCLEEMKSWELGVSSDDWREHKAPQPADPARGQGVSAAGRDRFDDRLADSRDRFLTECGHLAARLSEERGWQQIDVFGAADRIRCFRQGAASISKIPVETAGEVDLIAVTDDGELEARIAESARRLAVERDISLIEHALEEARGGTRGAAGPQETLAALEEGRVSHLIVDAAHAASACSGPVVAADRPPEDGEVALEPLAGRALASGAKVSTVVDEAAEKLVPVDGVAALLRY